MNEKSALGPIDPQVFDPFTGRFVPAQSILDGFEKARKVLEKEGPKAMPVYLPLLSKYDFTIFEICENAITFSKKIASKFLKEYMKVDQAKAKEIADFLCSHKKHLTHRRAIDISTAKKIGLKVIDLRENEKLNSAIWNLYCAIDLFFDRSNAVKLYENSQGISWSKNFTIQQPRPIQIELPLPSIPQSNPPEPK
jgi:DNA-directed RNA polymerase subunit F